MKQRGTRKYQTKVAQPTAVGLVELQVVAWYQLLATADPG